MSFNQKAFWKMLFLFLGWNMHPFPVTINSPKAHNVSHCRTGRRHCMDPNTKTLAKHIGGKS